MRQISNVILACVFGAFTLSVVACKRNETNNGSVKSVKKVERNIVLDRNPLRVTIETPAGETLHSVNVLDPRMSEHRLKKQNPNLSFLGAKTKGKGQSLNAVVTTKNEDFLAMFQFTSIARISNDGEYRWVSWGTYHHDLAVALDETELYTLRRDIVPIEEYNSNTARVDRLVSLDIDTGEVTSELDLYALLKPIIGDDVWKRFQTGPWLTELELIHKDGPDDVMHCNSVVTLKDDLGDIAPAGAVIISCAAPGLIAIVNPASGKLLWHYSDESIRWQHDASVTTSGRVMLFDNRFKSRPPGMKKTSRVIQIDPRQKKVVWEFYREGWFTKTKGTAQELSNGNIQVLYADQALLVEVTPSGSVVWERRLNQEQPGRFGKELRRIKRIQ